MAIATRMRRVPVRLPVLSNVATAREQNFEFSELNFPSAFEGSDENHHLSHDFKGGKACSEL